jgi:iron(III) transport system permease protein
LYALSSFGVPALLGMPVRQLTLTTLIYSKLKLGGIEGLKAGFALSGLLLAAAGALLWLMRRRDLDAPRLSGGKSSRASRVRLGPARGAAAAVGAWSFFGVAVVLPWIALGLSALAPVAGDYAPARWTASHLAYVWGLADFREALANSAGLALGVAAWVAAGGFALGYLATRRRSRFARAFVEWLGLPFATPGTVLAMGVLLGAVLSARVGLPLNEPLLMMGAAYAIKYAAVGARSMMVAFEQVDPVMEEAARVSGASELERLRTIWVPLLRESLVAAFFLAMLPMLTELTMSVLLTGPGASTLGTVLFDLQEYADQPSAAALAWGLMTLALVVGLATQWRRTSE